MKLLQEGKRAALEVVVIVVVIVVVVVVVVVVVCLFVCCFVFVIVDMLHENLAARQQIPARGSHRRC